MNDHIRELRTAMKKRGIRLFTAVTSDAHGSEYISEHDNAVEYISGFTGTNGKTAVTEEEAFLWTDGRYFIQAEYELEGSGIKLMKTGEPGVPSFEEWCSAAESANPTALPDDIYEEVIDEIWPDRPARPSNPIWIHDISMAGRSAKEKLSLVYEKMKEEGCEEIYVNALDDIAWVLNLRGSDIPYNPVFYSFLTLQTGGAGTLYLQSASLNDDVRKHLSDLGIQIAEYGKFEKKKTYSDIISGIKTHKTDDELSHMRESGLRDGVYMTKFIFWLKKQMSEGKDIDEIDASDYLDGLRASDPLYVSLSFPTISAYGTNAAIVHYHAQDKTKKKLKPKGLYLVDSGGQYLDGTTDVTRTVALGPLTDEEKKNYTLVVTGMLRVLNKKFTLPLKSTVIDMCAREMLTARGLDFNHSTGHGVGYFGYVHESPAGISRKKLTDSGKAPRPEYVFTGGEIVSDEPGVYIEGSHGIRIENMIAVREGSFENLTWVPLEREALDVTLMTDEDIRNFDSYQNEVRRRISPYLTEEERNRINEI